MLTAKQISELKNFRPENCFVTSVYLNTDGSKFSKKEIELIFKDLVKEKKAELESNREFKDALEDIERIERYIAQNLDIVKSRGIAIFSCSKENFWQVYNLMVSPPNILVVDKSPYMRPLLLILSKYHRIYVVLFDHRKARIFEIFMGEITGKTEIYDETPKKIKIAGYHGFDESRVAEYQENKIIEHYKKISDRLLELYQAEKFDWLIAGGRSEDVDKFVEQLHSYLKKIYKGSFHLPIDAKESDVLRKTLEVESRLEAEEEEKIAEQLKTHALSKTSEMAVIGIKDTIRAVNDANAGRIVFNINFSYSGKFCPNCNFIALKEDKCPRCSTNLVRTQNIVVKLIDSAIENGAEIYPLFYSNSLNQEGIGAFLRYRGVTKMTI